MSDELMACPFCSGERVDYDSMVFTKKGKVIYAKCPDCGTSFRVLEHVYNHRKIEERQAREVAELREECLAYAAEIDRLQSVLYKISAGEMPRYQISLDGLRWTLVYRYDDVDKLLDLARKEFTKGG